MGKKKILLISLGSLGALAAAGGAVCAVVAARRRKAEPVRKAEQGTVRVRRAAKAQPEKVLVHVVEATGL